MKINSVQFGEFEFEEESVINFGAGVIGFEHLHRFLLINNGDELFLWLNSVDNPDICFPLIGIRVIDENYPADKHCEAFGIVTMNNDPLKVTVNLKAPVYIDQTSKSGYQKIIDLEKYPVNYTLFTE